MSTSALPRSLGLGLIVACASLVAQAADRTVAVIEQVHLGVPPARAWDTIKDFMQWSPRSTDPTVLRS